MAHARFLLQGALFPGDPAPIGLPSFYSNDLGPSVGRRARDGHPGVNAHRIEWRGSGHVARRSDVGHDRGRRRCAQLALVNLARRPVCRKFPGLKFVFSEGGTGWLPTALERADRRFPPTPCETVLLRRALVGAVAAGGKSSPTSRVAHDDSGQRRGYGGVFSRTRVSRKYRASARNGMRLASGRAS
jgi:hypothetical protein